jgi:malate synthase
MNKVKADKLREVKAGHDGTWVAHPDLVKLALAIFDAEMPQPNQLWVRKEGAQPVQAADLISLVGMQGSITDQGVQANISVALQYMEAWLSGNGCVPIHHLMEDAATAEISRSQLWQWVRHRATTSSGTVLAPEHVMSVMRAELDRLRTLHGADFETRTKFPQAAAYLATTIQGEGYADFLTTLCYDAVLVGEAASQHPSKL